MLNSNFLVLNTSRKDIGNIKGQKMVEITNMIKDKKLSSGEEFG